MVTGAQRETWVLKRLLISCTVIALVLIVLDSSDSGGADTSGAVLAAEEPASSPGASGRPTSLTIAVTGEILPHPSIVERAAGFGAAAGRSYDFAALFADVAPSISAADLAICHLEVPVAPAGRPLSGYPAFAIPPEIGDGIAATGWDRCSTASNHSNDQGTAGIVATLDALDVAQVSHSGMARTIEEAMEVPLSDVGGIKVAHLSYTWGFNATPPAESWMANLIDPDRILHDASFARAAGASVVVVSVHWGNEHDTVGTDDQRALAERLLASPDIDLIVGHGPHVLQPIERYHDKFVLLSVGNLIANQGSDRPYTYDGVVATVEFSKLAGGRFQASAPVIEPTWYDRGAGRVRLVDAALADPSLASIHASLGASAERTRSIVGSDPSSG